MQPGHNVMTTDTVVGTYNHVCIWEGIGAWKKLYTLCIPNSISDTVTTRKPEDLPPNSEPTEPALLSEPTEPAILSEPTEPAILSEPTEPALLSEPAEPLPNKTMSQPEEYLIPSRSKLHIHTKNYNNASGIVFSCHLTSHNINHI